MSYVIHCWDRPLPNTLEEADAVHESLSDATGPEPPRYAHLRSRLSQALSEDPRYAGLAFDGLPLLAGCEAPMLSVGIPSESIDLLQPLFVREALALGLFVYDDQAGCCYHPLQGEITHDGPRPLSPEELQAHPLKPAGVWLDAAANLEALPPDENITAWLAARASEPLFMQALQSQEIGSDDEPIEPLWLQGRALHWLQAWFNAQGFVERSRSAGETCFERLTEGGRQRWTLSSFEWANTETASGPGFSVRCQANLCLPKALQSEYGDGFPVAAPSYPELAWAKPRQGSDLVCLASGRARLERLLESYRHSLDTCLLPLLEACRTPRGILAIARGDDLAPHAIWPTPALLKLVHWEGAPDAAQLMTRLRRRILQLGRHPADYVWPAAELRASPETFGTMRPVDR